MPKYKLDGQDNIYIWDAGLKAYQFAGKLTFPTLAEWVTWYEKEGYLND